MDEYINIFAIILIFLLLYLLLFLGMHFMHVTITEKKYETQMKKAEYVNMQRYTQEMENHYYELRKFKHDYQNILTSLESYIIQEDLTGLKAYFYSDIQKYSNKILHDEYCLKDLGKVKINAVKSILASKMIYAQDKGIKVNFEAPDTVTHIPMDTVFLVRVLGIFLDNAIEELLSLGHGELFVGLIKDADYILIIVQNTCRKDIPNIQTLQKQNFSTKSPGRGLGLSNVVEIMGKCPNVFLETSIKKDIFLQKMYIYDEQGRTD